MPKFDIVYSCTAHEKHEVVYNLYENIIKFNPRLNVLIVFHTNVDLLKDCEYFLLHHDNLIFHPTPSKKERFTSSIFLGHLENYRLISELDFDFFCPLASNCLFVCPIDFPTIQKHTPSLNVTKTGYKLPDPEKWMITEFIKNERLVGIFQDVDMEVCVVTHEGAYFRHEVMEAMSVFCKKWNVNKELFVPDNLPAEEILLPSIEKHITGVVGKRYCGWIPGITEKHVVEIIKTGTCKAMAGHYNNIVKVPRDMENPMRKIINAIEL